MCPIAPTWRRRATIPGILLLLSWVAGAAEGCPSMCVCKWKGGKEWVECANRGLKGLPQGAREETQVLDLSDNHLVSLLPECFHALGLINLQRLYLGRSHISRIAAEAFVGLVGLVELDLSENLIEEVPTNTFGSYPSLMRLILNGNPIREIRQGAFRRLIQLTTLEISGCMVEVVEQDAFEGLQSLEWLRLNGNRLGHVPDHTLPFGGNLRGLTLHNNPWQCDCRLRVMQAWLKESAAAAPQQSEPVCDSPARLRGRQIKALKINELACLPRIDIQDHLEVYEGGNVTLRCDVYAIPSAKVIWWFNGGPCELQHENNSLANGASASSRCVYRERGGTNVSSTLFLYSVETFNEGTYSCVAENSAGSAEANLSLRVLFREKPTVEPPYDNPGSGYVAAIAAGALVGTLFALGCLVGSVIYCARKRRRDRKRNSKALVTQSKSVLPITKDTTSGVSCRKGNGSLIGLEHQQMVSYTEREMNRATTLERLEHSRNNLDRDAYLASPVAKYLTEPDLINEVPESTEVGYGQLYGRHHQRAGAGDRQILEYDSGYPLQPDLRPPPVLPQVNYLDQDGYPLNFGLPKISFSTASTLPRLRQRMTEGSAAAPPARYSREAEFLARSPGYDPVLSRTDARYTIEGYPYPIHQHQHQLQQHQHQQQAQQQSQQTIQPVEQPIQQQLPVSPVSPVAMFPEVPFIPSPPAAYRGETTPLSPRSLLGKTAREAAAAAVARAEELQPPNHPESPDEGYVGDAMDV
ncbi:PREDICTED: leucine-rich repeat-containing protein 24-like [Dinoponera quadriceps]|uniref:Leucine-rich repeat-containing protein 24-like n=1 Tax=Dinoponera quadriceps TaxID=609295 RepID=A0A6P3XX27_DINQU|nr:PREDICTED: leucine-rich repeat-containing protein 24-like [Dinoponera quadriceps]